MNENNATATVTAPLSDATPAPAPAPDATPAQVPAVAQAQAPDAAPAAVEPDYRAMYESVRRENEILRHNAEIAQSAPVRGVSGGGTAAAPVDDFIRGFDSDEW